MIDSLTENEKFETEELNEKADTVEKCEDATSVNKEYEDIIRTKMKNIICIAYQQSKVFKRFRKKKFVSMVNKSTMILQINIVKLIGKFPKLMELSLTLNFLKNYFKDIKEICNKNICEFS